MTSTTRKRITSNRKRQALTVSILRKWKEHNYAFVRFANGDKLDLRVNNLSWVSLKQVIENPSWVTDWDCHLTSQERALLNDKCWLEGLQIRRVEDPTKHISSEPASE